MSIRFAIKSTSGTPDKEGDVFVRYTGDSEPFRRVSERTGTKIGVDPKGNTIVSFVTGLDENQVKFYNWYDEDEKKSVMKQVKELRKLITDKYGGEEVIKSTNSYFWGETRDVNRLSLTNEDLNVFFDTKNPAHALLYLSIIGGAFMELVAPTKDWADRHQIQHYMVLETEDVYDDNDEIGIRRSDAHALLSELRKEDSPEALFTLGWCLHYDTNAFGGYLKGTSPRELLKYHVLYIDGKLQTKKKRDAARNFIDYANKWKKQQTRPAVLVEAYVKAGEYYSFINSREKKYVMYDGTVLGNTYEEAVATLMETKHTTDLEKLRKQVEDKWNQ